MIRHKYSIKILVFVCCVLATIRIITKPHHRTATIQELKASKWITYFPNLRTALSRWEKVDSERLTSPSRTSIELEKRQDYEKGDVLRATITAFDEAGRRKQFGGDFFFIILRRPNRNTDGIACETIDDTNGSYDVECILPWTGQAILKAILVHPSESVFQLMMMYSSERHYGIDIVTTMKNSKNREEKTLCSVAFPDKRQDQVCNYSNPTHGEKRTCVKPRSGECPEIIWQEVVEDSNLKTVRDQHYFRMGYNFLVPIQGDGMTINVTETRKRNRIPHSRILRTTSNDPMAPTGWFYDSAWVSFNPKKPHGLFQTMKACVKNKRIYFVGDSTMRVIYRHFIQKLNLTDTGLDNSVAWSRGRDAKDDYLNLTMQYRSHGPPLLNPGPEDARPYISDTLDAITLGGRGSAVIITLGYHFHTLSPDVFLNRLKIVKQVMTDMMRRLPGIRVVIKGLHYHANDLTDKLWLTYRFEVMLRKEFANIPDVTYIKLWDWTVVAHNEELHPKPTILELMIDDILDAIC